MQHQHLADSLGGDEADQPPGGIDNRDCGR
jgi:hypothetical protein